jgi:hypothetical protein
MKAGLHLTKYSTRRKTPHHFVVQQNLNLKEQERKTREIKTSKYKILRKISVPFVLFGHHLSGVEALYWSRLYKGIP